MATVLSIDGIIAHKYSVEQPGRGLLYMYMQAEKVTETAIHE